MKTNTLQSVPSLAHRVVSTSASLALLFGMTVAANAMSEFVKLSVEPLWPTNTTPGNIVRYQVTAVRTEQGVLEIPLASAGLPAGATVTFSPSLLRFTGRVPEVQTTIMTVTCPDLIPTDDYPFTVTGDARRETITVTNQVSLGTSVAIPSGPKLMLDIPEPGNVRIRGLGTSGTTYQIEATSNLNDGAAWVPAGITTADANGRFTFTASTNQNIPARFFRAVSQPAQP